MRLRPAHILIPALLVWACGSGEEATEDEELVRSARLSAVEGFHAPEDLALLPGANLLVAEYGGITGAHLGSIKFFRPSTGEQTVLHPGAMLSPEDERWGEPDCTPLPDGAFAPHGFHLGPGPEGEERLLVVNHATRESIEMFELRDAESETPSLVWRGCIEGPERVWFNDVAGRPDGGLVASHMTPRGTTVTSILENTANAGLLGYALDWTVEEGWKKIPGTDGLLANGIEASADGAIVYVDYYMGDEVAAFERTSGRELWRTAVDGPDNPSWTASGRLLVASHRADLAAVLDCHEAEAPYCGIAFGVVSIDPDTGEATELYTGGGEPFGGATVAVEAPGRIYLGCFTGTRMGVLEIGGSGSPNR